MKNLAVVNALDWDAAGALLGDGRTSLEKVLAFGKDLPGVEDAVVLTHTGARVPAGTRPDSREKWSAEDLLDSLRTHSKGFEDVFYFHADCPMLDAATARRMHENHRKYFADYTYADGYPRGLAPEIMRSDLPERLSAVCRRGKKGENALKARVGRETVFDLVKQDINSFDIETELAERDQRLLRISLTTDTRRNRLLISRLMEEGCVDTGSVTRTLEEKPWIQRTLPAFFPIQITEQCPQKCSYCPYPGFGGDILQKNGFMPVDKFASIAGKIADFCGDAVIDISLWGEPALHPDIAAVAEAALTVPGIELVIETAGVGWKEGVLSRIASGFPKKPSWIVSLDARSADMYGRLRGNGFAEAEKTARDLVAAFPDVYVQAVRMKENEEDLEGFFSSWKERTDKVIVQKYDHFCGVLPDRTVSDLSPLQRFPCWHLRRDMPVLLDGTVPLCREDLGGKRALGNVFIHGLQEIWREGESLDRQHIERRYPEPCIHCDEWYTYNF